MVAVVVVSASEIKKLVPDFHDDYELLCPEDFRKMLWNLGCDTNKPIEKQEGLTHRNRLNEVVTCSRWVANERTDSEWIKTGYASREAKNLSSGSSLVRDLDPHKYHEL